MVARGCFDWPKKYLKGDGFLSLPAPNRTFSGVFRQLLALEGSRQGLGLKREAMPSH